MSNITLFVLVSLFILSIYLLWKNMDLQDKIYDLNDRLELAADENTALATEGQKYKDLYHRERVLNTFREPLQKK